MDPAAPPKDQPGAGTDDKIETACQFPSHQMPHCLPSVVTNAAGAGTDEYGPDTVLPQEGCTALGLPSVEICAAGAVVDEPVADVVPQEVVYDSSQSVLDDLPSAKTDAPGTGTNKPSAKTDAPHIVVPHPHVDGGGLGLPFLDTDAPDIEGGSGSGELPCIELVAPGAGAEASYDCEVEGYGSLG